MESATREARALLEAEGPGGFADAPPRLLVGLYAVLHAQVYGVAPEELAEGWKGALSACARLLGEPPFDGDPRRVVAFLRHTWAAEKRAEERARGTGQDRRRIGWRLQFVSRSLVVDWKRAMVRR